MRQNHKQTRAKRAARYARAITRLRFKLADQPNSPEVEKWRAQLAFFEKAAAYMADSPYLLDHDPFVLEKLDVKITRLQYLSVFYRKANDTWRKTGGFEGIILTKYWRETMAHNIQESGVPVPEKWFWRLRTLLKHYRNRRKRAENWQKSIKKV